MFRVRGGVIFAFLNFFLILEIHGNVLDLVLKFVGHLSNTSLK